MDKLLPLLVSFLLTTVLGGLLASYLQQRSWTHQNEARLREDELRRAGELCQTIGQLLDKRRYRMLRLLWTLEDHAQDEQRVELIGRRLAEYDAVLYEYNDRLNVNLSLMGTYFGARARARLEEIYEAFAEAGRTLTAIARTTQPETTSDASDRAAPVRSLEALDDMLYELNVYMMARLRDGQVGRQARDATQAEDLERALRQ